MRLLAAFLLCAALAPHAFAAPAPAAAPAGPRLVRLVGVEGLPREKDMRAEFEAGLAEGLAAASFPVERLAAAWQPAGTAPNRFRPTTDPAAEGVWTLQVVVGAPPPFAARTGDRGRKQLRVDATRRASRGMTLALLALSPEAIAAGVRAMPDRFAFAFPAVRPGPEAAAGGFEFPWRQAGRTAATLALELLHHRSGDLPERARGDLAPAVRAEVVR